MKGTYDVLVEIDNVIKYNFSISRQITLIQGNSGTGKTLLHSLILEYLSKISGDRIHVYVNGEDTNIIDTLSANDFSIVEDSKPYDDGSKKLKWERNVSGKIIILDEDYVYLNSIGFISALRYTDNYYVIFSRDTEVLEHMYNSIWDILKFEDANLKFINNTASKMYDEYYGVINNYSEVIHEDSTTGEEICQKALDEIIKSSYGNINIVDVASEYENTIILIVADGANFGNIMSKLKKQSKILNNTYYIILPESTEYVLLHNIIFSCNNEVENLISNPESIYDSIKWITYEKMYEQCLVNISRISKDICEYKKKRDLKEYISSSFIDTYSAILNKIEGIESSYSIKFSTYKIVNGEMIKFGCKDSSISSLNRRNKL